MKPSRGWMAFAALEVLLTEYDMVFAMAEVVCAAKKIGLHWRTVFLPLDFY